MKQSKFTITENKKLAEGIYRMRLAGDVSEITSPGQFINIKLDGHFLRRPISVNDVELSAAVCGCAGAKHVDGRAGATTARGAEGTKPGVVTIIYKVLGQGTEEMTAYPEGKELDVLTGLGNGYDTSVSGDRPLLIGGGVGIPPMYLLAKRLLAEGKHPIVILGFNKQNEIYYVGEFKALGCEVHISTADGSAGTKGFVTDVIEQINGAGNAGGGVDINTSTNTAPYTYFYTCGPEPMLRAVSKVTKTNGQMSFEERMGCGFGACMGCSCKTLTGYKRICKDGPVMLKEEIQW